MADTHEYEDALAPGSELNGHIIRDVLGKGAFGITYLAEDTALEKRVAIKEYYPVSLATRRGDGTVVANSPDNADALEDGRTRFVEEARTVARLRHPNIVEVQSFFEANGTAYMVMRFYEGLAYHEWRAQHGTFDQTRVTATLPPLMDALAYMHERGVIHRDIKPANVYLTHTGEPILLDFGAAKEAVDGSTQTGTRIGSAGYAALEQSSSRQKLGPWTDIYGLSATYYRMTAGETPPPADERGADMMDSGGDPYVPLASRQLKHTLEPKYLTALDAGMALNARDRPQTVEDWKKILSSGEAPKGRGQVFDAGATQFEGVEVEGRRWGSIIATAVVIIALLGAVGFLIMSNTDGAPDGPVVADGGSEVGTETEEPRRPVSQQGEAAAYARAVEIDTLQAYRDFLEAYPDGEYAERAQNRVNEFDEEAWQRALTRNTEEGYREYLETFPEGLHAAEAQAILDQLEADRLAREQAAAADRARQEDLWRRAQTERTLEAVDAYLDPYPAGLFSTEARALRRELASIVSDQAAWRAARELDTKQGYESYLAAHPRGAYVPEALEAIERFVLTPGEEVQDCVTCPRMKVLPRGTFTKGASQNDSFAKSNEKPAHVVTFSAPFAMSIYEVTFDEYDACVADNGCPTRPDDGGFGRGRRPVVGVTWQEAVSYTEWLTRKTGFPYSLPSESQWEYAARAGSDETYPSQSLAGLCVFANGAAAESGAAWSNAECSDPGGEGALPVGLLQANVWGLHDMLGNVAEWTLDCLTVSYRGAPADGSAAATGLCGSRVVRGGGWFSGPADLRFSARAKANTGSRNLFTGFRVVRGVAGSP